MNPAAAWDRQFEELEAHAKSTLTHYSHYHRLVLLPIFATLQRIGQLRLRLHRKTEWILAQTTQPRLLGVREKTLLHWASEYCQKLEILTDHKQKQANILFWLNSLLRRAVPEQKEPLISFEKADLSRIHQYTNEMQKYQKACEHEIAEAQRTRKELSREYLRLTVTKANREASGCLVKGFGRDLREALDHEIVRGVSQAFSTMADLRKPRRLPRFEAELDTNIPLPGPLDQRATLAPGGGGTVSRLKSQLRRRATKPEMPIKPDPRLSLLENMTMAQEGRS